MRIDHPTFYHIGSRLENHERRIATLEVFIQLAWKIARIVILIALWSLALLINASPSFWADLTKQILENLLSS